MRGDARYLGRSHLTRAGRKDETDGIRSELGGELCIIEVGVRADFDPHGGR